MNRFSAFSITLIAIILTVFMLVNPRETITAASFGFSLWYSAVLPALFPFFVSAELLVESGFVNTLGKWLEPIMKPFLNLPGCSSLAVVMGFTSGFPVGAILTKKLYERQMLNGDEAERLVSFTNNCSPLFIIGAVGVGMLGNPTLGYLLAAGHYFSNLLVGFLLGLRSRQHATNTAQPQFQYLSNPIPAGETTINIGKLLGNAINQSISNILAVGGFIVTFAVLTRMLSYWGLIDIMANILLKLLAALNLSYPLAYGFSMGLFEITLGSKTVAAGGGTELLPTLLVISAILALSGLSIIAQVMSIMAGLPVRLSFYLKARAMQMLFSIFTVKLLFRFFPSTVVAAFQPNLFPLYKVLYSFNAWRLSIYSMLAGLLIIILMAIAACFKKP